MTLALLLDGAERTQVYARGDVDTARLRLVRVIAGAGGRRVRNLPSDDPRHGLVIRLTCYRWQRPWRWDGWTLAMRVEDEVTARWLERVTPILRVLERRIGRVQAQRGGFTDVNAWVLDAARALGVRCFVETLVAGRGTSYDEDTHRFASVVEIPRALDALLAEPAASGVA